jgi:Protein of unknown function (DUF664)
MDRAAQPGNAGERELLLGWLAFHRDALQAKCEGLTADQLVARPAPPSDLSLLGLVRHMTEMEHVYLVYALAGGQLLSATESLGAAAGGDRLSVRWNLIKLIREYARHNGHAD